MFCMSCQETMITKDFTNDLDLIAAIQKAENKVIILNDSLPEESKNSISSNYIIKNKLKKISNLIKQIKKLK